MACQELSASLVKNLFVFTCIPLNALSDNLRMVLNEKSSFVIGKFADVNVYFVRAW